MQMHRWKCSSLQAVSHWINWALLWFCLVTGFGKTLRTKYKLDSWADKSDFKWVKAHQLCGTGQVQSLTWQVELLFQLCGKLGFGCQVGSQWCEAELWLSLSHCKQCHSCCSQGQPLIYSCKRQKEKLGTTESPAQLRLLLDRTGLTRCGVCSWCCRIPQGKTCQEDKVHIVCLCCLSL